MICFCVLVIMYAVSHCDDLLRHLTRTKTLLMLLVAHPFLTMAILNLNL